MEQLPGTGNSQIELDFDNKYDNVQSFVKQCLKNF